MLESNSHVVKRPLFASGVNADCHRRAGTKRGQQQIIRRSAGIFAPGRNRFIGRYSMAANADLLSEAVSASTDDNPVFHKHVVLLSGLQRPTESRTPCPLYFSVTASHECVVRLRS